MDIKPDNILIDTKTKQLWLIDFGLAVTLDQLKSDQEDDWGGTVRYTAPEILLGQRYCGENVDIWSAGVVIVEWVRKYYPWKSIVILSSFLFSITDSSSTPLLWHQWYRRNQGHYIQMQRV